MTAHARAARPRARRRARPRARAPRLPRRTRRDAAPVRRRPAARSACCSSALGQAPPIAPAHCAAPATHRGAAGATQLGAGSLAFYARRRSTSDEAEALAVGLARRRVGLYASSRRRRPDDEHRTPLTSATILVGDATPKRGFATGVAIGEGHRLARTPRHAAGQPLHAGVPRATRTRHREAARHDGHGARPHGDGAAEEMGSLPVRGAGHAAGSEAHRARVLAAAPTAQRRSRSSGKGLCFDSGGISIKPAQGMERMKFDMCGAAGVLGAMEAIGGMKLPINVVGLIGVDDEHAVGHRREAGRRGAERSNGKYIEIINTDAEGRLVLADVLSYASALQAGSRDRRGDAHRRLRDRARPHGDRRDGQRRRARRRKCSTPANAPASRAGRCRCGTTTRS